MTFFGPRFYILFPPSTRNAYDILAPADMPISAFRHITLAAVSFAGAVAATEAYGASGDDGAWLAKEAEKAVVAGQFEEAIAEYRRFLSRPDLDAARRARAETEAKRLEEAPAPFSDTLWRQQAATIEAKHLFDLGKRAAQQKRYGDAVHALQAADRKSVV